MRTLTDNLIGLLDLESLVEEIIGAELGANSRYSRPTQLVSTIRMGT
jgi:hypothetical protein